MVTISARHALHRLVEEMDNQLLQHRVQNRNGGKSIMASYNCPPLQTPLVLTLLSSMHLLQKIGTLQNSQCYTASSDLFPARYFHLHIWLTWMLLVAYDL